MYSKTILILIIESQQKLGGTYVNIYRHTQINLQFHQ